MQFTADRALKVLPGVAYLEMARRALEEALTGSIDGCQVVLEG